MEILEELKSVLCDPKGIVCIKGSEKDIEIVQDCLTNLVGIVKYAKHNHVNAQDGTDFCKDCNEWLTHPIHISVPYKDTKG